MEIFCPAFVNDGIREVHIFWRRFYHINQLEDFYSDKHVSRQSLFGIYYAVSAVRHKQNSLESYTDANGSAEYNDKLSEKRAAAVKNALVNNGIDPQRVKTVGFGESRPILSSHALSRRVKIVINPFQQGQ